MNLGRPRMKHWTWARMSYTSAATKLVVDATDKVSEEIVRMLHSGWTGTFDVVDYGSFEKHLKYIKRMMHMDGRLATKWVEKNTYKAKIVPKMPDTAWDDDKDGFDIDEVMPRLLVRRVCAKCGSDDIRLDRTSYGSAGAKCARCGFGPEPMNIRKYAARRWEEYINNREYWKDV